ncbi:ArsO family NAD(P)H-dependent flavin-containing monooxygenase [Hoyosella altamirensis]|uniref:Cation diffusion facilitator CzcD-associated flavoprotein CzcO n=1 Tax=Hoyosella altamirensis TaxID=616997 RepID=A0A839RPJ0_9ACTN|nr:ArsO family NAD(P)H-dependent flavin-containing monooxygenase [Hoyosella altamirensis]MBB3038307.1 cation diffusion facilitator CzcD-associated flavoprotein CzcO [Hoyosella altamirensis]
MASPDQTHTFDAVVIGGGQAGLACGYYLRRAKLDYIILDDQDEPGGAWRHTWPSLRLFSPASFASLPGWFMPEYDSGGFPPREHVLDYLRRYEHRYQLPVRRPVTAHSVSSDASGFAVETSGGIFQGRTIISATGTWRQPHCPTYPGLADFSGRHIHSAHYTGPDSFVGQRVAVVGGGNSGAQIAAELAPLTTLSWLTSRPPRYLPDDVDGRILFQVATEYARNVTAGRPAGNKITDLGDIVAVPEVRKARDAGILVAEPMFERITADGAAWADGTTRAFDTIIWCTGFRPAVGPLKDLHLRTIDGHIATHGTQAAADSRVFLVGYGDWTGPASATLLGVGRTARDTVAAIQRYLGA